jgi:hypothetical protein
LALVLAVFCACQRDRPFHTVATYETAHGRYAVRMEASGLVRAGADVSEESSAVLRIAALDPAPVAARSASLRVAMRRGQMQFGSEALSRFISGAGCSGTPEELEELLSAVNGVLLGPKGTLMAGQTRVLKVASTTFE